MNQFTVIITATPNRTADKIRNNRDDLTEKSKTYLKTRDNHRILLKPPKRAALKGYDADVVINETSYKNLVHPPARENTVKIQV